VTENKTYEFNAKNGNLKIVYLFLEYFFLSILFEFSAYFRAIFFIVKLLFSLVLKYSYYKSE